jgi:hypothetical protein
LRKSGKIEIMNSKTLPRLQDIFYIALFAAVLLLGGRMLNLDGDLPRHLLTGKYILENKTIPSTELFIYPYLNRPYVSHEWLANVIFYAAYQLAGLAGIVALSAFLLASTFTLLYSDLSTRLRLRIPVLILVAWGALATSLNWAARPHLISMLLLAVVLTWADKLRRSEKISLWFFPALMILWVNTHGEFIAGILVLLAYSVGWLIDFLLGEQNADLTTGKNLWLALIFSAAASLLNPGGISPWFDLLGFVNNRYLMSRMMEANSPNFQLPELRIVFLLILFSVFLLSIKRERISASQGILLAGFTAMCLMAFRNIHLYGVVAPFVLAETLGDVKKLPLLERLEVSLHRVEHKIHGAGWIIVSAILLTIFAITYHSLYQFSPAMFPVQAVNWLEKNPQQGRMFNDLNWGGYLEWRLNQLAFVDSVADKTGEVTMQYETVATLSSGWQDVLKRYDVQWIIVRSNSPLVKTLPDEYGWKILYQDDAAVVLGR